MKEGNLLIPIFARQAELMEKFHEIEEKNGVFKYQDGGIPVDPQTVAGVARLKDTAWRVLEEVAEALDAKNTHDRKQELADALHFYVELCILSGIGPEDLPDLENIFIASNIYEPMTAPLFVRYQQSHAVTFLKNFGMAMNRLKAKPWKLQAKPINVAEFHRALKSTLTDYITLCRAFGVYSSQELHDLYFRKSEINKERQRRGD